MKHTLYKTQGTCSQFIDVTVDDEGVVQQDFFMGGCENVPDVSIICVPLLQSNKPVQGWRMNRNTPWWTMDLLVLRRHNWKFIYDEWNCS